MPSTPDLFRRRRAHPQVAVALLLTLVVAAGAQGPDHDDQAGREQWFWSRRSYPSGVRPYEQMALARSLQIPVGGGIPLTASQLGGSWRPIGPYGLFEADAGYFNSSPQMDVGRVIGVAPPRVAGGPLLIAAASGGVWRASSLGSSWAPVTDNQCWLNMGAITSDPVNPSIIYAATGEYNIFSLGCGVLRSADGGNTWTSSTSGIKLNNGASAIFGSLFIDPATAGSASSTIVLGATAEGLVRSVNSASTWSLVLGGSPSSLVSTRTGTIFAGMRDFSSASRRGVWKSTNTGSTWTQLPPLPSVDTTTLGRVELAVSAAAPDKVYALVGSSTRGLIGLFQWDDVAATWTQLSATGVTTTGAGRQDFGKQSDYDLALAVDPRDATRIYIAGVRAYRSTDGGASFTPMGMEIHCDWHAIVIDPRNPDILYAGTDGGFFASTDLGSTWISYNGGLAITQYYPGISVHPSGTIVMGGSQDNGTQMFNASPFWDGISGGDGGFTAINYSNPSIQYSEAQWSTAGPSIYRTQSGARTARNSGISSSDRAQFIPPLVMDPVTPTTLYFGTQRLYRTTNEGTAWAAISADLTGGTGSITAIAIAPSDALTIYVGTSDAHVQVSRDGGATFTPSVTGLPTAVVTYIVIDRADPTHALLTMQGYGSGLGHVFETNTAGASWRNISGNLPNVGANAVAFINGTSNIFVANDMGVFQTIDDGTTWQTGPAGLPNVIVNDLVYQPATQTLVAATFGRGMFTYAVGGSAAVLRGDVNGDGKIDAQDALLIQQALISKLPGTTPVYPRGDANCNGAIDAADVVLVLRAAVGLPTGTACVGTIK